jgi:phage gpG-like protein
MAKTGGGGFQATFSIDTKDFLVGLADAQKEYDRRAKRAVTLGKFMFIAEVKKTISQKGTGRVYTRGGVTHVASAPGQPPVVDQGGLKNSIAGIVEREFMGWVAKVGTGIEYGRVLELGGYAGKGRTTFIAARPYLLTTLMRIRPQLIALFSAVLSGAR